MLQIMTKAVMKLTEAVVDAFWAAGMGVVARGRVESLLGIR